MIHIAFTWDVCEEPVNTDAIFIELKSTFDAKWASSAEQPTYTCHHEGLIMSFFSASLGTLTSQEMLYEEGSIPTCMYTFGTPTGVLCVLTASLPRLPSRKRGRLLKSYTDAATNTDADCILVGGSLLDLNFFTKLSLQEQVTNLSADVELHTNADLFVLARSHYCTLEWSGEIQASSEPDRFTSTLFVKICAPEP